MAVDPTSGNYFYITKDPYDALSNISVHSQYSYGSQLTLISGLNDPLDIVLHAEQG